MFKKIFNIAFLSGVLLASCHQQKKYRQPAVKIETSYGDIIVELYPDKAPKTVAAFLSYVDAGYYKGGSFYRVLKSEDQPSSSFKSDLIQGGIWQTKNKMQTGIPGIPLETTQQTGLHHHDGTISLARLGPNTGSTEFFILIGDEAGKDYDYGGDANEDKQGFAAFGQVVDGMEVVKQIHEQPDYNTSFTQPIAISNIVKL
ncbi:MAG TPA: peptidylprolyl isomerase [Chitinophagaceae bacterium]|nr:peptidylprolyl isomerase [Chitinophagaceae bacterium]